MTARHLDFFGRSPALFPRPGGAFHLGARNSFARFLDPRSLDDAGSMCAAHDPRAPRRRRPGPGAQIIASAATGSRQRQFRLPDGTLARKRPQAVSLWADDMYMGIPALAELGRMTGERAYYDDAVKNVLQMSGYLFNPQLGLYTHGWNAEQPGRAALLLGARQRLGGAGDVRPARRAAEGPPRLSEGAGAAAQDACAASPNCSRAAACGTR